MAVLVGKKLFIFNQSGNKYGGEIVDNYSLDQFLGKKTIVLFFYPKDFTFVCPTELFAFQEKIEEFEKKKCTVNSMLN